MGPKQCKDCHKVLTVENAYPTRAGSTSLRSRCKECTYLAIKEYRARYRAETKEERAVYDKKYRAEHRQEINARNKRNELDLKAKRSARRNRQYREDPAYNMEHRYRTRIQSLIRVTGIPKGNKTLDYLGCTKQEFLNHIESKFMLGMTWENRNQWDIDHIEPCCAFDLSKEEERIKCFHYLNLRPLWKEMNKDKIKQDILWKKEKQKLLV